MAEYISREDVLETLRKANIGGYITDRLLEIPAADVQPLSVIAEHIKKRLYETAFNTTEGKTRNAIADMAGRIDFWINELKDGDTNE